MAKESDNETSFVDIDESALDRELVLQASTFYKYALRLANANRKHSEAKAALDVVRAELSIHIRKNPTAYLIDSKLTEAVVESTIEKSTKYQEAIAAVIEAKHRVDVLKAATDALEHKKKALEGLVVLDGRAYYAKPQIPNSLGGSAKEELETQAKKKVRSKGRK